MTKTRISNKGWLALLLTMAAACGGELRVLGGDGEAGAANSGGAANKGSNSAGSSAGAGSSSTNRATSSGGNSAQGGAPAQGGAMPTTATTIPTCDSVPPAKSIDLGSCMQPSGGWPLSPNSGADVSVIRDIPTSYSYKFTGTVKSVRTGLTVSACSPSNWGSSELALNALTVEREVDGKIESYDIEYQIDKAASLIAEGDKVDVNYVYADLSGGFGLPERSLTLQNKNDCGSGHIYVAQALDVSKLADGSISFAQGALSLECSVTCGTIKQYNLLVVGSGFKAQILPGGNLTVSDTPEPNNGSAGVPNLPSPPSDPSHGYYNGYLRTVGTLASPPCMDWSASGVSVAGNTPWHTYCLQ